MTVTRRCTLWWRHWPSTDDPVADRRAFEPIVREVADMVPLVEVGDPGRLSFATRGPSRHFGGDEAMVALLVRRLPTLGLPVGDLGLGAGVADSRLAALLAARQASTQRRAVIVPPGSTRAFLGAVPVRVLAECAEVPFDVVDHLDRLGFHCLGDVAAMDPADLLARFGHPGRLAHLLATGLDDTPLRPEPPAEVLDLVRHLETPLPQVEAVVFVARQLAEDLIGALAHRGQVCTQVVIEVETEHGERSRRCWNHSDGFTVAAVVERVRWQLAGWVGGGEPEGWVGGDPPADEPVTGGVVLVRLMPEEVRADRGRQVGLWGGQSQADAWAVRAVARVVGLLGHDAVRVPEWRGGRDPWQRYRLVPASSIDPDERLRQVQPVIRPWPGGLPAPAPAIVWDEPTSVELLDAAGSLVRVSGRGELSAAPARLVVPDRPARRVTAWAGPWPLEERWWDPRRHRRQARLQVVTDDGEAVLVVIDQGRWWVPAVYA